MNYILSQEELDNLVPKMKLQEYHLMLCNLRTIYLDETKRECVERGQNLPYCAGCPIKDCCTYEYQEWPK